MVSATTDRRQGLTGNTAYKAPVTALATTNITQYGEQTVGGVACLAVNAAGVADRVLCTGQTTASLNGIWDVSTAAWTRSIDANGTGDFCQGSQVLVAQGTYANQIWELTTANPITVGTTSLTWSQSLSAGFLSTLAATSGAGLSGFDWALNYTLSTVGWGIKGAGTDYNILRDILPANWAAVLDGTTVVDHSTILQARINTMAASIGGTIYVPGVLLCNTPILLKSTVSLRGASEATSQIKKDSTTTLAVTIVAGVMVVYTPGTLPSNINCVIALTDNGGATGRYNGSITDISIVGTLTTPANYETQKNEFGIVSLGSVSDSTFRNVTVTSCTYGFLFPSIFASQVQRCKTNTCLSGFSVDNGTSTNFTSNYSNYSRDWGYFLRDLKYSLVSGNACDSTNDPTKYPTRTRECSAYRFRSAIGLVCTGNGDEQTYGNSVYIETFSGSVLTGHLSIGIGSDYIGANQIGWIKSDSAMDMAEIFNNHAYDVKGTGLTSGGAVALNHHNIYAATPANCWPKRFENNVVAASRTTMTVEAGWGNDSLAAIPKPVTETTIAHTHITTDLAITANSTAAMTLTLLPPANNVGKTVRVQTIAAFSVVASSAVVVPLVGGAAGTAICSSVAGKWADLMSDGTSYRITAGSS